MTDNVDDFALLIDTIKRASSLAPTTYNTIDLAHASYKVETHIQAVDMTVQEDLQKASTLLSNIEVLSNIYNELNLEEQDINTELNKIRKMASEVSSISSEINAERGVLSKASELLDYEIDANEKTYLSLTSGQSPLQMELEKYGMTLLDFMNLPLRTPSEEAVKKQLNKIVEERLNGETKTE